MTIPPAAVIALRALRSIVNEDLADRQLADWHVEANEYLDRLDALVAPSGHQHEHRDKGWRTDWRGRFWVQRCECGDEIEGQNEPAAARVEPQDQSAPAVHHLCKPSNVDGAPPIATWCRVDREWQDGAAKQFDYTCLHCGERISVNISQWRKQEPVSVRPAPRASRVRKDK